LTPQPEPDIAPAQDHLKDHHEDRVNDRSHDRPRDHSSSEPVFAARQSRTLSEAHPDEHTVHQEERRHPRRAPWVLAWTGWAVAAGCSFVAGVQFHQRQQMQGAVAAQQARLDDMQTQAAHAQQAQEALSTLTAANAMQVALHETPPSKPAVAVKGAPPVVPPEALAAYLADKGALVFVATHMQPAPAGKTYELWLLPANGQNPIPAGTFKPDAQGTARVMMPKLPKGIAAKGFGVTVENDGGSPTPTLPIVMS
jgi:anti-sigma-K factor RskA